MNNIFFYILGGLFIFFVFVTIRIISELYNDIKRLSLENNELKKMLIKARYKGKEGE